MWNRFKNIQTILFSTYSLIIIVVFTILVIWFYLWASDLLRNNAIGALDSSGQAMQDQIDAEIRKMNDVSLNVMYSNLVKNRFKKYLSDMQLGTAPGENPSLSEAGNPSLESAKELAEILTAAIGPTRPVEQLYLYDFENKVYGNGFDNGVRSYAPESKSWFQPVLNSTPGKYINLPVPDDEMSKYISTREKQYSVSLLRLFYDSYNAPIGIVEVKQYYNRILKSTLDYMKKSKNGEKVLVFRDDGSIIYPLEADAEQYAAYIDYSGQRLAGKETQFNASFKNPATSGKELLSFHHSDFSGWNTIIIVSESKLLQPLFVFARTTVLVAFIILLFAIALSYAAARRITYPILKIHRSIRSMRLDDLGSGRVAAQELNSGLSELDQLHGSFLKMSSRLKQSMDELLLSQSQELQAKLIALNTQMNPHFLYNTLATISVMAEENMNEQIVSMSENMSDILRYIASDPSIVELGTELLHTKQYLEVNQLRHGQKLHYSIDVGETLLGLQVPKLIVQPLVENALKFVTRQAPPWTIAIKGRRSEGRWTIEVSDSGPGFSAESLAHLEGRIAELGRTTAIPVLQLGGMGLLNIYIRMKLTYGENAVFRAENLPGGGACITLGGTITGEGE